MNKTKDMTVGSPTKTIFFFSVPVLLGTLFQQIYNMADTIIVGQFWVKTPLLPWGRPEALYIL